MYPKSAIYPPGTSTEEESKQAKADMVKSQDTAIIAAVNYLQSHPEIMADTKSQGVERANQLDTKKIVFKTGETGGPSGGLVFSIGLVELFRTF